MVKKKSDIRITGISLPEKMITYIDNQRGDINRSKYVLRILEKALPSEVSSFSEKVAAKGDQ